MENFVVCCDFWVNIIHSASSTQRITQWNMGILVFRSKCRRGSAVFWRSTRRLPQCIFFFLRSLGSIFLWSSCPASQLPSSMFQFVLIHYISPSLRKPVFPLSAEPEIPMCLWSCWRTSQRAWPFPATLPSFQYQHRLKNNGPGAS